jgi:DNA-binding response OmpR family regulator
MRKTTKKLGRKKLNQFRKMKILIVEDEPKVASFIKKGLDEQGYETEIAYDGLIGKKMIENEEYGLFIFDVNLPHLNGYELCKKARLQNIKTPILMLTAFGATEDIVTGLDSGADDYLVKPFKFQELLARVRALTRRQLHQPEVNKLSFQDLEMDLISKTVKRDGHLITLTAREFRLLEFFLRNPNKVLSRADIAENVWDINFDTGTNVVDVYMNYLRKKIDKGFSQRILHTIVGMGYVLKAEHE